MTETPAEQTPFTLLRYPEHLVVVRLGAGVDVPSWATSATLFSVTATATETTVVCAARGVPRKTRPSDPYAAFAVEGPLDLGLTGVLHALTGPLAEEQVPVYVVSTFDTDWLLVPVPDADRAAEAWRRSGCQVRDAQLAP